MIRVPKSIAEKARSRVKAAAKQRSRVLQAVYSGRPLDGEPEQDRKLQRLQKVAGVDTEQAEELARYEKRALSGLAGDKRLGAERIQGKAVDFVGVAFLEVARAAASTVGRVILENLQPVGSGFMISDSLFLTNNHVIPSTAEAKQYLVEFNYEMDINRQPKAVTRFTLNPDEFFITNPEDQLDFTIVAIGKCVDGKGNLSDFGYCPLIGTSDKHVLSEFVNIIQHPEGDYKQIVIRENRLVTRLETVLHYLADTMPGSSGSPVFNDQWEAIALHHWGEPTRLTTPDGKSSRCQ
jgi:endonuclease G